MKSFLVCLLLLASHFLFSQDSLLKPYGFRHIQINYEGDKVDILVQSRKGEELKAKPLFFFAQGSMPQPLIKYLKKGIYDVFPFDTDSFLKDYHLVIVGKPGIPLICDAAKLSEDFTYRDSTGIYPKNYSQKNLLSFYVQRNGAVIRELQLQKWVSPQRLVLAGHSEGSTIVAKMAKEFSGVTDLIYSGGNPCGRILSMIQQDRRVESAKDSIKQAEEEFKYWEDVVNYPADMISENGADTYQATYEFSIPPLEYLNSLSIPVLVTYGTKDFSAPYTDYFRSETIRNKKKNFTFKAYIGTDHNFFPLDSSGKPDQSIYNWTKVGQDWYSWLKKRQK